MRRFRVSLRTSLVAFAAIGVVCTVIGNSYRFHKESKVRETNAINSCKFDLYGYETENYLPAWLRGLLPQDVSASFRHITEIDFQFNDLSSCDPKDVRNLHQCEWVHTLHVPNATMSKEMFDAVSTFPRLKKIYFRHWFADNDKHEIDLRDVAVLGLTITYPD